MVGPCLVNWGGPGLNQSWSDQNPPDAPENVQVYLRTVGAYASVLNSHSHPQDIPWRSYPTKSLAACTSFGYLVLGALMKNLHLLFALLIRSKQQAVAWY